MLAEQALGVLLSTSKRKGVSRRHMNIFVHGMDIG